jgi:anti-sigma regulatory factor (Ser/Thr protein kinase)
MPCAGPAVRRRQHNCASGRAAVSVVQRRGFPARMAALQDALDFAAAYGAQHGIGSGDVLRLTLIIEELYTNTVLHGHGGDCDAELHIELHVELLGEHQHLHLCYEDVAPPFDPLQHLQANPPPVEAGIDERAPGGLGIALVVRLAERIDYAYIDGRNRVRLQLRREG